MTTHHHKAEEKSIENIYYLVGLLSGLFVGAVLGSGLVWVPVLGIFGLLFAGFFITLFVKSSDPA